MSEKDNLQQAASKQTSCVPLKKETVRVTLKAADAPPAVPSSATVPQAPPARPPAPTGISPVTPSAPMTGAPRPTAPAPTVPLRKAGPPTAPTPAPTVRLATSAPPSSPGAATAPLKTGGVSPTLPKATVQLQVPTQPLGTSFPASTQPATFQVEDDEEVESGLYKILSSVGLVAAIIVLVLQLAVTNVWLNAEDQDPAKRGDWMQLFE